MAFMEVATIERVLETLVAVCPAVFSNGGPTDGEGLVHEVVSGDAGEHLSVGLRREG